VSLNGRFAGHRIPLNFDYRQRVRTTYAAAARRRGGGERGEGGGRGDGINTGLANPEANGGGGPVINSLLPN
jgi:hypothetical protein